MKKFSATLMLFFTVYLTFSQPVSYTRGVGDDAYTVTIGKNAGQFFKSYEDYIANKPVDGYKLVELKPTSVKINENGTEDKVKPSKLKYNWFCNADGMLMRVFDGEVYHVVVEGPLCLYIKRSQGTIVKPDNKYHFIESANDFYPAEFYSLTISGPISKLKDNILEEYLQKHGLLKDYENDPLNKREWKDCVECWKNKQTNRKIKYVQLLNTKMK